MNVNNSPALPAGYTKRSIETDSISFFGEDMMLQVKFLDRLFLSLTFRPLQYDSAGNRKFPKKDGEEGKYYYVTLNKDDAMSFVDRLERLFIPKFGECVERRIEDPTFNGSISTGIMLSAKSCRVLDIASGKPGENGYEPRLRLISEIDGNCMSKHLVEFKFGSGRVIDDYDPSTGEYKLSSPVYPQILIFKKLLEAFIFATTASAAHDITVKFQQKIRDMNDTIDQIAIKNDITPKHTTFGYTEKAAASSPFVPAIAPAEMKEVALEDMLGNSPY